MASGASDERAKVWRHLLETPASFEITEVRVIESPVFVRQQIEMRRALALIGLHGTGKTMLLRMLEAAFGFPNPINVPPYIGSTSYYPPGVQGILEIELKTPQGLIVRRIDLSDAEEVRQRAWPEEVHNFFSIRFTSPLRLFFELTMLYQEFDLVTGAAARSKALDVPRARLKAINQILGRSYERMAVYPHPFTEADLSIDEVEMPYFLAYTDKKRIDSAAMSQGELWVHYVLSWFLDSEVTKEDLALLDEPEAFLAARAQRPFIDQVARQVLSKNSQLIVGTHSPEILARFPLDNIRMCIAGDAGIRVIKPSSIVQIRESIGIETPIRMLILVEDELAGELLRELFTRYDRTLVREAEIVPAGGKDEVVSGLRILDAIDRLSLVGVLDADQRRDNETPASPLLFLPGSSFPERELVSAAQSEASWVADRLSVTTEDILASISSCRGMDHQYWLDAIARNLGLTEKIVRHELAQAWLRNEKISQQAQHLVENIRSRFPARR